MIKGFSIYLLDFIGSNAKPHIDPRASLFVILVLIVTFAIYSNKDYFQKIKNKL